MKKSKKPEQFVKTPGHLHGTKKVREFIKTNLKYPKEALENRIEGIVQVMIEINDRGSVVNAKIKKGLGHGCDEEALRLAKLLKFESKGHRKMRVVFHKTLNIAFNLKEIQKQNSRMTYTYKWTEKSKEEPKQDSGSGTYTYTINIG